MISAKDLRRYEHALKLAYEHKSFGKFRMVATAYKGKKLISVTGNLYPQRRDGSTIHPIYENIGVHAELALLHETSIQTASSNSVKIYVAGYNANDTVITSRPCPRCNNLLRNTDAIKSVTYFDGQQLVTKSISELGIETIPIFNSRKSA